MVQQARPEFRIRPFDGSTPVGERGFLVQGESRLAEGWLQPSDILCVVLPDTDASAPRGLAVLEPRTPGHPMLGRATSHSLAGLPSGLPCDRARWRVGGTVRAIWRRGLWRGPVPVDTESPPSSARFVYVRVPQAALALARSLRPPRPGASLALADPDASGRLAEDIAARLGPSARVERRDPVEVRVQAWLPVTPAGAAALAREISGQSRLAIALAVADHPDDARAGAEALGPDELLWGVPGRRFSVFRAPRTPAAPLASPLGPEPVAAVPPAGAAPSVAEAGPAAPPTPGGPVQLGLFDAQRAA
ncbi:MAG: hypothetical protein JXB39_06955 [Deltaproteobacteria bacterium]|nr:hypothetical protein [Deltaproteobacteria bacterium]